MQWIKNFIFQLSEVYIRQTQGQIILPELLIFILRIQSNLLSFSYIIEKQEISYLYTITIFARPQIFLPNTEIFSYIIFVMCVLSVFQGIGVLDSKIILIFTTLMKSGIINFVFEICIGQIQLITQLTIIFISFIQLLISEGTFNINLINFDKVQVTSIDYILAILNYLQMFFYKYSQSQIYLEIFTLMVMILQVLNLCLNHTSLYNYQKSLFLTIQIFSIYIWLKFYFSYQLNDVSELISIPFIFQIVYSYLQNNYNIQQFIQSKNKKGYKMNFIIEHFKELKTIDKLQIKMPKSKDKQICFASILIIQNKYYDAFQLLKSLQNNKKFITRIKIKLLIEQCLKQLANISNIEQKGIKQISQISDSIIQSENSNIQILQQIKDLIQLKLDCLNLLLSHKTNRNYCQLLLFVQQLIDLQQQLEYRYECYPSQKTQNILGFLYSEIINDYFSAHELKSVSAISDEKMRRITLNQDIFSNKMIYLLANFDGKLKINSISNDSGGILNCSIQDLFQQNVDILVPPGVSECHDQLVLNFFETGSSKYIRQINSNFLYNIEQNYFQDIEFATDMSFTKDLKFIIFIQPQNIQSMALILDNNRQIKCFSKALIDEIKLNNHSHLIGKHINKILPSFPVNIQKDNFVENALAYFQNIEEQLINSSVHNQFNTQYSIQQRKINEQEKYIIVKFYYFKSTMQSLIGSQQSSQTCEQELFQDCVEENGFRHFIGVESQVFIPIDENNQRRNRGLFEVNVYAIDGIYSEHSNYLNEQKFETTNIQILNKQSEELLKGQKYFSNTNLIPSKLSNIVISKQKNSHQQQQDNFPFHDEQSSYVSSMQGFKKSIFYKKYLVIQKIKLQQSFLKDQKLFILFLILCLIFQIALQLLQLIQISQNLDKLVSDVDLLEIKNLMYQPFESFLLTRWTLNELNTMHSTQIISEDQFEELTQFPKSNLNLGFDQLNDNLKQVLDRLEIQSFLENTYTNISVYTSTDTGEIYNLSLRNSIQILLSYQYDLKMRYAIEGSIVSDSPYVYFSYRNYITLKDQFTSLNEFVLKTTIQKSQQELKQIETIFAISIAQLIIFKAISKHYFLVIRNKIYKFFSLFKLLDTDCIMQEISYLNYLLQQLKKDQNYLYQYKINIELKEQGLEQLIYQNSQKRLQISVSYFKQFSLYYFLFIFIVLSSCGNAILTYTSSLDYLQKYPFSVQLFKKVSDVGTDVPTMYAQRQILYRVSYIAPFLNHYDIEQIFQELNNSLIRTQNFNLVQISLDNLLISESFKEYFTMIQNQNLCDLLPEFLKIRSEFICLSVMDQSLSRGLITTLEYICNFILTDMQISNFSNQTTFSYSELEGAFLVSNIIAEINTRFHQDFLDETSYFINQITIHNVIILLIFFSIIIFILIYVKDKLVQQYFLVQRIAYLIPIKAIIFNDSIERNLRQLLFEGLYSN